MKFDMHVKNIRNMKFNNQIFKIHKKKKKKYMRSLKSFSLNQFRERLCSNMVMSCKFGLSSN